MRVEQRVEGEEERLSTEELHALRARLFGETSTSPKPIATVADLAEFLGRPPEDVWRQLDRLRAEKAFAVSAPAKASQWPLLGVAVVLLGAAFGIYKITPRPLTDKEIDDRVESLLRELASKPKKIHYPILKNVAIEAPPLPGFAAEFEGMLTKTIYKSPQTIFPQTVEEAKRRLKEELRKAYEDVRRRESEAPIPSKPLVPPKNSFTPLPSPDHFILKLTTANQPMGLEISTDPRLAASQLDKAAEQSVDMARNSQEQGFAEPLRKEFGLMPPPGFSVKTILGTSIRVNSYSTLAIRPIDPGKVRHRLELALRYQIHQTTHPNEPLSGMPQTFVPGSTLELKVNGPLRPIEVTLPLKAGGNFKTAADAMREYERLLAWVLDEAEKQIREINAGEN